MLKLSLIELILQEVEDTGSCLPCLSGVFVLLYTIAEDLPIRRGFSVVMVW